MKNFILLSALLLVPGATAIAQNNLPPEVREMARMVMMPVVYKVPGTDKVKVISNLKYNGISWKYETSVLAMGFMMIGHQIHHLKVIEEKYFPLLQPAPAELTNTSH